MKYLSICSGIEAASVAFEPLGWKPLAFSEIEAFPRAVLQHHYPDVPLHGDFTKLRDEPWIVDADMLVGGTPCFVAGTLILAKRGLIPIETVRRDDEVWTHKGRWRRVVQTMSRRSETMVLKGQGHWGIETTAEHPFWARHRH